MEGGEHEDRGEDDRTILTAFGAKAAAHIGATIRARRGRSQA